MSKDSSQEQAIITPTLLDYPQIQEIISSLPLLQKPELPIQNIRRFFGIFLIQFTIAASTIVLFSFFDIAPLISGSASFIYPSTLTLSVLMALMIACFPKITSQRLTAFLFLCIFAVSSSFFFTFLCFFFDTKEILFGLFEISSEILGLGLYVLLERKKFNFWGGFIFSLGLSFLSMTTASFFVFPMRNSLFGEIVKYFSLVVLSAHFSLGIERIQKKRHPGSFKNEEYGRCATLFFVDSFFLFSPFYNCLQKKKETLGQNQPIIVVLGNK